MIISIKNLRLKTVLGVYDWEKKAPREAVANISMEIDGSRAATSDDLQDTVDYDALSTKICAYAESRSFQLVEKLAADILGIVMENPLVKQATVHIEKPCALKLSDSVSVSETSIRKA